MKLSRITTTLQNLGTRFGLRSSQPQGQGVSLYYSTAPTLTKPWDSLSRLYRRISPFGDPKVSIVPILDQWISEGHTVSKPPLLAIIKELRRFKRYTHALEVSIYNSPFLFLCFLFLVSYCFFFFFFFLLEMCEKRNKISN